MARVARVVVVGSSNTDMVARTPRIPAAGETVMGSGFMVAAGGKGANQAVGAARMGARVTLVARLGRDTFGDQALAGFEREGIDAAFIVRDTEAPSGIALIAVDNAGQNSIVVAPGANDRLTPADVEAAAEPIAAADVVVVQLEVPLDAVEQAARMAAASNKTFVLNPAPARPLPPGLLGMVGVLTPNEVEAAMLLGLDPAGDLDAERAARQLLQRGPRAVVITLGSAGCVTADRDGIERLPARAVKAIDTTAAGDCFTGALACGLAEGLKLGDAARLAMAAAAISVTRVGAQPSMPYRHEVEPV